MYVYTCEPSRVEHGSQNQREPSVRECECGSEGHLVDVRAR